MSLQELLVLINECSAFIGALEWELEKTGRKLDQARKELNELIVLAEKAKP